MYEIYYKIFSIRYLHFCKNYTSFTFLQIVEWNLEFGFLFVKNSEAHEIFIENTYKDKNLNKPQVFLQKSSETICELKSLFGIEQTKKLIKNINLWTKSRLQK